MKPLQQLSIEDLLKKKVWKYFSKVGNDESVFVQSTDLNELSETDNDVYVALTRFTLSDGTIFTGYCSPTDPSGLDYIQPVIIFDNKHLILWDGISAVELSTTLEKEKSNIFPILFESQVPVDGKIIKSSISQIELQDD